MKKHRYCKITAQVVIVIFTFAQLAFAYDINSISETPRNQYVQANTGWMTPSKMEIASSEVRNSAETAAVVISGENDKTTPVQEDAESTDMSQLLLKLQEVISTLKSLLADMFESDDVSNESADNNTENSESSSPKDAEGLFVKAVKAIQGWLYGTTSDKPFS
ncbi:hypothetical protein ACFLTD_02550, partial [Elusimicrobiota bacterium]